MDIAVFLAWKSSQSPRLLDTLVRGEEALVRRCAIKFPPSWDGDDILQAGRIGVLKALAKFDPARGAWTVFAKQYIKQEMQRGPIEDRPTVRTRGKGTNAMPRTLARKAQSIEANTGISATAQDLGVPEALLAAWRLRTICVPFEGVVDTDDTASQVILTRTFWRALASLTETEARVLLARVLDEKTFDAIAKAEGHKCHSESRVVYLQVVNKMRKYLESRH